jgi:aerobic carbon-monoxide dehydrogenase large subunit
MRHEKFGMGAPVTRVEDGSLITGQGRYLGDIVTATTARGVFARARVANARFTLPNLADVRAMPGVKLVLTAADLAHLGELPVAGPVGTLVAGGKAMPGVPLLARGAVRFVGDAVAFVVADTEEHARAAAEALEIATEDLPVVVEVEDAVKRGAPAIHQAFPDNIAFEADVGDRAKALAAMKTAVKTVSVRVENNRLIANYMEPRGALADYDPETGRFTVTLSLQGAHGVRKVLCEQVFRIPTDRMRVIVPDVGGGFGTRYFTYREYAVVCAAAEKLGKPVAWLGDRSEHFLCDYHGRDWVSFAKIGFDGRNKIVALHVETLAAMGGYMPQMGAFIPTNGSRMGAGVYVIPAACCTVKGVFTNTVPLDAYRGAGRPEAAFLIERLMDVAAAELGVDPVKLRKINFIKPKQMPFKTLGNHVYDSGDFAATLDRAIEVADFAGFKARLKASKKRGMLRGLGFASYIEACAGGSGEESDLRVEADGTITVLSGTQSTGQGHQTAYGQLAAARLGIDIAKIRVVQGDTALVRTGGGTGGSRSLPVGGMAVDLGAVALAEIVKKAAADALETAVADIELVDGTARVVGTDKRIDYATLAAKAAAKGETLQATGAFTPPAATYPNGTHVVEVEVDPGTGAIEVLRYVAIDDFGDVVNPILLAGQVHGGIVQGLGQAIVERTVYDRDNGQLLTASFLDYAMPRADDTSAIHFETLNVKTKTNALGIKGAGEAGTVGATPAVANAVIDAIRRHNGLKHLDTPFTPEKVWVAINA